MESDPGDKGQDDGDGGFINEPMFKPSDFGPPEWRAVKDAFREKFGRSPRTWLMRECGEVIEARQRWHKTGVLEYPPYYERMRVAIENNDTEAMKPFTINGHRIMID